MSHSKTTVNQFCSVHGPFARFLSNAQIRKNHRPLICIFATTFCWIGFSSQSFQETAWAQDIEKESRQEQQEEQQEEEQQESKVPEPRTNYKGREIARTMHFSGAEWLTRDERENEERCSMLLTNMGLAPGQVVCDMGVGNGYYALQIAQLIGDEGRVLGVDVQPEMLEMLRNRMEDKGIANVTPILGSYHDPNLPDESCDLILMVDVYHEFSYPELMLAAMRKALKPKGRIVLVEYRTEDPDVPIKPEHKMSKKQILKEYEPNGFKLVAEFDDLPWQHVMFFEKDE